MSDNTMTKDAVVIERTFDAPVDLIWQMWTQAEQFKNWYGPKGHDHSRCRNGCARWRQASDLHGDANHPIAT